MSIKVVSFLNGIATVYRIRMTRLLAPSTPTITASTVPMKTFASILRSPLVDARISPNPPVMCPPASGAMASTVVPFHKTPTVLVIIFVVKIHALPTPTKSASGVFNLPTPEKMAKTN